MNFLFDENVGRVVANFLQELGHVTFRIRQINPGIDDYRVLDLAFSKNAVLITSDKDFGQLIFKERQNHFGVILLRIRNETSENKISALKFVLLKYSDRIKNNFLVVSEKDGKLSVRVKK